jgi:integrase
MKGHVRERGKGNWYAVLDAFDPVTGKRKRKWHKLEASGKKEAETEKAALVTQLASASYIDAKRITLANYLERWLTATKPSVSPRTFERYAELVRKNIVPLLGATQLKKLNGIQIAEAYTKALESGRRNGSGGLSPQTVLHMHRVLKGALKQAVLWKLVHFNEAAAVRPPKPDKRRMNTYDMDQTATMLDALKGKRIYIPALLAALCGLRRGEISALRWGRVDLDNSNLKIEESVEQMNGSVRLKEPKSGRSRSVALPASVRDALRAHKLQQAQDLLKIGVRVANDSFVAALEDGSMMQPTFITHEWVRAIKDTALPRTRFHDLRHAHATHMLSSGVHPKVASERLGHSKVGITLDLYSHVLPGMQEDAVAKVDAAYKAATKPREQG